MGRDFFTRNNMKIYIAGKVTGLLYHEAVIKFAFTEQQLIAAGIDAANIINPISHVPEGTEWPEAMEICLPLLRTCTAIFIQRDWFTSDGTRIEIDKAREQNMDLFWEQTNGIKKIKNLIETGI